LLCSKGDSFRSNKAVKVIPASNVDLSDKNQAAGKGTTLPKSEQQLDTKDSNKLSKHNNKK